MSQKLPVRKSVLAACLLCLVSLVTLFLTAYQQNLETKAVETATVNPKSQVLSASQALGHLVVSPRELGFKVQGFNDEDRLLKWLDVQLLNVRQLYRREAETKKDLMGTLFLELTVDSSGVVTRVNDVGSRIQDHEFRKAVVEETYKWKFPEFGSEPVKITYPLVFVRERMDLNTVLQWEQALGILKKENEPQAKEEEPKDHAAEKHSPQPIREKALSSRGRSETNHGQSKAEKLSGVWTETVSSTPIRNQPRFALKPVDTLPPGTRIQVAPVKGGWLEIRYRDGKASGFIRKEYAAATEVSNR